MKKKSITTPLHDYIVGIPKDTRDVIKEMIAQTGLEYRKIWRHKNGHTQKMSLTDATLLSAFLSQYYPAITPEDLIPKINVLDPFRKKTATV